MKYSKDGKFLKACLDMGLYVSFTANLTFKKAEELRAVARRAPIERVMLETDAPYLLMIGVMLTGSLARVITEWQNV